MLFLTSIVSFIALATSVSAAVILPETIWIKGSKWGSNLNTDFDFTSIKCARTTSDYVYKMGVTKYYRPGGWSGKEVLNQVKLYCITPGTTPILYTVTAPYWSAYGRPGSETVLASYPVLGYTSMTVKAGEIIDGINVGTSKAGVPSDGGSLYNLSEFGKIYGVQWAKFKSDAGNGPVIGIKFYTK